MIISWAALAAVLALTSLVGCLALSPSRFLLSRSGWYLVAGIVLCAGWLYATGLLRVPIDFSLAVLFAGAVWRARRQRIRVEWRVDWKGLAFVALATLVLGSLVLGQRVPEFGGELVLQYRNAGDALWHIALIKFAASGVPPVNPVTDTQLLSGYHYFTDLYWAAAHRATGLSAELLYVWVAPLVLSALFASSVWRFFNNVFSSGLMAALAAALVVFGSGLAFAAGWFFPQAGTWDSVFWLDQPVTYANNQQLLLSLAVLPLLAWLLFEAGTKWWLIALLAGLLAGIKVYATALIVPALLATAAVEWWRTRDHFLVRSGIGAGALAAGVLLSSPSQLGVPFFVAPGWFVKTMFEAGDRLNYPTWEIHRQLFRQTGNWPRLAWHWLAGVGWFLAGNFGGKILGLLWLPKRWLANRLDTFLALVLAGSLLAPLLFLQKGIVWNSIQFAHYAQLPLAYFLARGLSAWGKKGIAVMGVILLLAMPTTIRSVSQNLDPANLVRFDQTFLRSVAQLPEGRIIVAPGLYDSSAVPALSGRPVYWANGGISSILGLPNGQYQDQVALWLAQPETCPADAWIISHPGVSQDGLVFAGAVQVDPCGKTQ